MLMNMRSLLIALHETEGIGWRTIAKILPLIERVTQTEGVRPEQWKAAGMSADQAEKARVCLHNHETSAADKIMSYRDVGVEVITLFDECYPELLKQTAQPPWVLYARGDLSLLSRPLVAVVGTRTPTVYGKRAAEELARGLSQAQVGTVSGLARGIDSAAHRGALLGTGSTIAVMGCGIDQIYPAENRQLYRDIIDAGLVVSEYPSGTPLHPGLFPLRNRIIAGLSLGTVVVEAALRSGSLITADQALDESRDVFAVPGPIHSPKSQGALSLIKQGAKMVTCAEDILEEYGFERKAGSAAEDGKYEVDLTPEERDLLGRLSHEPLSIDQLIDGPLTDYGKLHGTLLTLQMKKLVEQLPGAVYIKH
jgi:DNA processing protein